MIQIVDNYNLLNVDIKTTKKDREDYLKNNRYCCLSSSKTLKELSISLQDYIEKSSDNTFFSFFKDEGKKELKNEDDLIISIKKDSQDNYLAQTGNYVGKFFWDGLEVDIKSRFSNKFLERMLNFTNDIYLDDVSVSGEDTKELDISRFIIYYMFVQNLEKAFLLGLPKAYKSINYHDMKVKGKIDINRFIKNDIPFKGKISSTSREQKEIIEIIDVLYKAVKIIDNSSFSTKNISHIKTHLKQNRSNKYVSNETINKAIKSKALQNPIFSPYKKVLEYAKYIINGSDIKQKENASQETYGFLVNVAELFEIYVTKLLAKEFPDWGVSSPKIELYNTPSMFYQRKIIPDIVMIKDKEVMVFDTKYKRMLFRGRDKFGSGDVDRNDFFQINTYMSYYQNHKNNYNVKVGGLLYPFEKEFNKNICYSENWFDNSNTKFIIDGIDLSGDIENQDDTKFSEILKRESSFINRVKGLINQT
ncbi:5-methylcytosine restriction system specificity protein McrC [Poseidonibacter ostreae]|uniref:Restriction endonuclease n=1 Tax=Poseidonibacter ostreae TaxID=2654171 RepID=A0A6L4WMY9_9BACT|nr:hypothetical protein [Poseidonibacter ostreae]KAB7881943.1 hypothetical protein GA417_14045 [Poseidonibacter ostreae]KAB7884364.1 hypothetical protein GBG19_15860 [Poseidonibacter ostreae]KAB7886604.1 hypothetical protein GBG18_14530 [Poseidonibacter ostreae]